MSTSTINAVAGYSTGSAATASALTPKTLNQDDFLKLLITQLTSQDPLNPQTDSSFIAQMAQFSSLEQAKSMEADISQLRSQQEVLQADSLLGRSVVVQTGKDTSAAGVVSAVQIDEAGTPLIVINGQGYGLSAVRSIAPAQP